MRTDEEKPAKNGAIGEEVIHIAQQKLIGNK